MRVSEIFQSIQGEGRQAGRVSVFVRLAGCNLRCRWCDTPYALHAHQGRAMDVDRIVEQVGRYHCESVVVTGGEPLIWPQTPALLQALKREGKFVTLETNATQYRPIECDLASLSPKLAGAMDRPAAPADSGPDPQHKWLNRQAIEAFVRNHMVQIKFVVADRTDLAHVERVLQTLPFVDRRDVLLMPQARTKQEYRRRAPQVARMCIESGLAFGPRLQIELWGRRRGH
ncbi:MAG: 7-carboxy-7-deazaguanine synthase QueE [Sedimentisphaerales bacterium]|nr:7-carboxy-7-deazaguanine synthase QueE [Sedimentisphaerales bacterium]